MQTQSKAIRIVVQADEEPGCSVLFSTAGDTHLCHSVETLANFAVDLWRDPKVEPVEAGPHAHRWTKLLAKGIDAVRQSVGAPASEPRPEGTAVLLVLQMSETEAGVQGAVWPPDNRPRMFRGRGRLGELLDELARDDKLERVPAGPPVDPGSETLHEGGQMLVDWLRGGAA